VGKVPTVRFSYTGTDLPFVSDATFSRVLEATQSLYRMKYVHVHIRRIVSLHSSKLADFEATIAISTEIRYVYRKGIVMLYRFKLADFEAIQYFCSPLLQAYL
jgi:hypothetical protein